MLSVGLMSGTSMDGIDAALLQTDGSSVIQDLGYVSISYAPPFKLLLKSAEYAVRKCFGNIEQARSSYSQAIYDYLSNELGVKESDIQYEVSKLSVYLQGIEKKEFPITLDAVVQHSTYLHFIAVQQCLEKTGHQSRQIDVIGYHGQTMFHRPDHKISVVVGDGQYLADQLGITVVNDFRSCDVAAGGQGAPFAPIYHYALALRDKKIPLAVVNCGGITNLSLIPSENESDLIAFDAGPGNSLIDSLVRQRTRGKEHMDTDGQYGKQGSVNQQVLKALYEKSIIRNGKNYFLMPPPKSLDYGDMVLIPELNALSLEDACATLEAFSADAVIESVGLLNMDLPRQWILAGGGWKNPVIRYEFESRLRKKLGDSTNIFLADDINWNSQAMEAQIFAYLAVRCLENKPLSFPGTTGVSRPLLGGCAWNPRSLS
jgi:anhydro-N-acetylmuramic acid kinase